MGIDAFDKWETEYEKQEFGEIVPPLFHEICQRATAEILEHLKEELPNIDQKVLHALEDCCPDPILHAIYEAIAARKKNA